MIKTLLSGGGVIFWILLILKRNSRIEEGLLD